MAEGKIHQFEGSLEVEKRVRAVLAQAWRDLSLKDVTQDKLFQNLDVDFVYTRQGLLVPAASAPAGPKEVYIELKADSTKHHNIFFEFISNAKYGVDTPGCFIFSRAYAWAYVFEDTRELFFFELEKMRYWILGRADKLKPYLRATTNKKADGSFAMTVGCAIPVAKLLAEASPEVPMTYMKLPGYGEIPEGSQYPKLPRLPKAFRHMDKGLEGIVAMLEAAKKTDSQTKAIAYKPETSPLRRHVIEMKVLAFSQTNGLKEFAKEASLGPHYLAPLAA